LPLAKQRSLGCRPEQFLKEQTINYQGVINCGLMIEPAFGQED